MSLQKSRSPRRQDAVGAEHWFGTPTVVMQLAGQMTARTCFESESSPEQSLQIIRSFLNLRSLPFSPPSSRLRIITLGILRSQNLSCHLLSSKPLVADVVVKAGVNECPGGAADVIECLPGAVDAPCDGRERLVPHSVDVDVIECPQGATDVFECLRGAVDAPRGGRERLVPHSVYASGTHHRVADHDDEPSLAKAGEDAPPSDLLLYTWNIEGKHDLVDASCDLHWDILCLQEVGEQFEAPGHLDPAIGRLSLDRDRDAPPSDPILCFF